MEKHFSFGKKSLVSMRRREFLLFLESVMKKIIVSRMLGFGDGR